MARLGNARQGKDFLVDDNTTLGEAKAHLMANIDAGTPCPCCNQRVQLYRRRLRANHARFLVDLVRLSTPEEPWVHYRRCFFRGRDYNFLPDFGLAETGPTGSGLWRPTQLGVSFVTDDARVPAWVGIYNNTLISRSEETVTIHHCLVGTSFDLEALLSGEGS